ncbi:MAG: hypothetical protein ACTSWY_04255 [Promethearchaeota archaeon]
MSNKLKKCPQCGRTVEKTLKVNNADRCIYCLRDFYEKIIDDLNFENHVLMQGIDELEGRIEQLKEKYLNF